MRKQITAANWKMNLSWSEAEQLLNDLLSSTYHLTENQEVIIDKNRPIEDLTKLLVSFIGKGAGIYRLYKNDKVSAEVTI